MEVCGAQGGKHTAHVSRILAWRARLACVESLFCDQAVTTSEECEPCEDVVLQQTVRVLYAGLQPARGCRKESLTRLACIWAGREDSVERLRRRACKQVPMI